MWKVYNDITQQVSAVKCTINCSRRHGQEFNKWCDVCRSWKDHLHKYCRYKKHWDSIKWSEVDTQDFPYPTYDSFQALAKVFVREPRTGRQGLFRDLGAVMSLFINMKEFDITKNLIFEVQKSRNLCFAHNYSAGLHNVEKTHSLNSMIALLKEPTVMCTESARRAIKILKDLLVSQEIPQYLLEDQETLNAMVLLMNNRVENVQTTQMVSIDPLELIINNIQENITRKHNKEARKRYIKHFLLSTFYSTVITLFIYVLFYGLSSEIDDRQEDIGCLSLRLENFWKSELDFDFYVNDLNNDGFIERTWLKEPFEKSLYSSDRGVLLTADMGYGKSSILSNIICAKKTSAWYDLRKNILTYHLCRYDMVMSRNPDIFIRNMAGIIVNGHPDLGNSILFDDMANHYLYGPRCAQDPIACLEFAILQPLRDTWGDRQFIILIDALDECVLNDKKDLLYLLYTQINRFPSNIKFIMTSRAIDEIKKKFVEMTTLHLNDFGVKNENDIRKYIHYIDINRTMTINSVNSLVRAAEGNFLHVKLYLSYCLKTHDCNFNDIPPTLEKTYILNFDRVFREGGLLFENVSLVFKILCATDSPLNKDEVFEIAKITGYEKRRIEMMFGQDLAHFIQISHGKMSFVHKSIVDFLTDTTRRHTEYFVDANEGHALFTEYYFQKLNHSQTVDIVELVYHVAMSYNSTYENTLLWHLKKNMNFNHNKTSDLIHRTVIKYNNYRTTSMIIQLVGKENVDIYNQNNTTPAFVAARQGHHETLACLLDNGADFRFRVEYSYINLPLDIDYDQNDANVEAEVGLFEGQDIVEKCKYVFFCGYILLHIASQNGHLNVVQLLLQKSEDLNEYKNEMSLNSVHIAAENGYFAIVKFLLSRNNTADHHALYLASRNGNPRVVDLLLQNGIKDECLPCNNSFYWIPKSAHVLRRQRVFRILSIKLEYISKKYNVVDIYFYDDWRLITCETALNAAIRNGHKNVVQILIKQDSNALNCTTYDGKTVLMTAIMHNQTDMFKTLYTANVSVLTKCINAFNGSDQKHLKLLSPTERQQLILEQCPKGVTISHLLAMYNNFDMAIFLYKSGFSNWQDRDSEFLTPLHYAFCHGSITFILLAKKLNLDFRVKSVNGSTPYHSAAICGSTLVLYDLLYRKSDSSFTVPDLRDNKGRSILHYGMLPVVQEDNSTLQQDSSIDVAYYLIKIAIEYNHDYRCVDVDGRNFLHYAAKSGNYYAFTICKTLLKNIEFAGLLSHIDLFGKTPFEELYHSMIKRTSLEAINIPAGCDIKDVFYTKCNTSYKTILSPHELCILQIFSFMFQYNESIQFNITELILESMHKNRIYPILMLKVYFQHDFNNAIATNPEILQAFIENDGPDMVKLGILSTGKALRCSYDSSPLHRIIANNRNIHWLFCNEIFLEQFLRDYTASYLDTCFDKNGMNLLHRAAMGGNIIAVDYLVRKGMNLSIPSKYGYDPLSLSVLKSPFHENGTLPSYFGKVLNVQLFNYVYNSNHSLLEFHQIQSVQFDETAIYLLRSGSVQKNRGNVCKHGKYTLGLLHLAAAKGLLGFVKECKTIFGVKILDCRDYLGITPYSLAKIYKQTKVLVWLEKLNVNRSMPHDDVLTLLMFNLLTNYRITDWTCGIIYNYQFYGLIQNQIKKCFRLDKNEHLSITNFTHQIKAPLNFLLKASKLWNTLNQSNPVFWDHGRFLRPNLFPPWNVWKKGMKHFKQYMYRFFFEWVIFKSIDEMVIYDIFLDQNNITKGKSVLDTLYVYKNSILEPKYKHLENLKMDNELIKYWLYFHIEYQMPKMESVFRLTHVQKLNQSVESLIKMNDKLKDVLEYLSNYLKDHGRKLEESLSQMRNVCNQQLLIDLLDLIDSWSPMNT